jgi:hypothetical protein
MQECENGKYYFKKTEPRERVTEDGKDDTRIKEVKETTGKEDRGRTRAKKEGQVV